ncbi:MAG: S-layer homology domain-containing protein [Cyanobacteria bacterium SIG26]|nr:S-layer homology domain-containing protein [Cyanobacteria bacterium SIG26]
MKKLLKMLLSIAILSIGTNATFAYPDVDSTHWAAPQIKLLSEQGVIVGYPDGTFKPDANVTRAEFAAMAIRALGQQHTKVAHPVNFTDINEDYWAYNDIQKALYFDLISCDENGELFRPEDSVSRAESMTVAVNALTTETISLQKAKDVLAKMYIDANTIPEWFIIPAGKAEILGMIVASPTAEKASLEATRPATRAEVTAILFKMMEQAKLNPNAKLAEAMRKKTGEGFVVENATVQGSIGTIPAGSILPIKLTSYISSQTSEGGTIYTAAVPQNYVTKEKFILIREGAALKGQLLDVRPGKYFVRNGVLVLQNGLITTENDQATKFRAVGEITKDRNWWMKFVRWAFKGEQLEVAAEGSAELKLLEPLKIDLTNGWIYEE